MADIKQTQLAALTETICVYDFKDVIGVTNHQTPVHISAIAQPCQLISNN